VNVGNASACKSLEVHRGFGPYLLLGRRLCVAGYQTNDAGVVYLPSDGYPLDIYTSDLKETSDTAMLRSLERARAPRWYVTSMNASRIVLAGYEDTRRSGKPTRIKKLTRDELDEFTKQCRALLRSRKNQKAGATE
jgi:hypothetical protein